MYPIIDQITRFLSRKDVSIAILVIVVASRIFQIIFFYNIGEDGMLQTMAMQNFVHGHDITLGFVRPENISAVSYQPLVNWPPGYSLILAPFYLLFDHQYIPAGITMDIVFSVLLFYICIRILRLLDTEVYLINLFLIFSGFFIYYFYFVNSSDAIAISIFLISVYFTLLLFKKKDIGWKTLIGIVLPLFIAGLIKYLFIPVVFVIPALIFLYGYQAKTRRIKNAGLLTGLTLMILFGLLLFYENQISGNIGYISQPQRGFYAENLAPAFPAIPGSFIKPDTLQMLGRTNNLGNIMFRLFQFVHVILVVFASWWLFKKITGKNVSSLSVHQLFYALTILVLLAITAELLYLSLRVGKEENVPGNLWTYIEEGRYYGLVNVMLHICFFSSILLFRKKISIPKAGFIILCCLLLLPEFTRGVIFTSRRIAGLNKETYIWQLEKSYLDAANNIITTERKKNPAADIITAGSLYYLTYRVGLYSHAKILPEGSWINDPALLNTEKPAVLLIILEKKKLDKYKSFLAYRGKTQVAYLDGFYYYILHVNPH